MLISGSSSKVYLFILMVFLNSMQNACTTSGSQQTHENTEANSMKATDESDPWFPGTIEEAFALAKKENKPLFIYWGAIWCPPCNEMKSTVFNQQEFRELMKSAIAVFLDGDSEQAQFWGDKLGASGYPTLMFLNSQGEEVMRISTGVNIAEFSEAFRSALELSQPLAKTIAAVLAGKATESHYRLLAHLSWEQMQSLEWDLGKQLEFAHKLVNEVPKKLQLERLRFIERLLKVAVEANTQKKAAADKTKKSNINKSKTEEVQPLSKSQDLILAQTQKLLPEYLDEFMAKGETIVIARGFLNSSAPEMISWLAQSQSKKIADKYREKWLKSAENLANSTQVSIDTRLWSVYPELALIKNDAGDKKIVFASELIAKVKKAVQKADQEAKTDYERKAVIAGASYLLDFVGETALANQMLEKELATSTTPYYYESMLASRAKKAGDKVAAFNWATKARKSAATGRATRLQWLAFDLQLSIELAEKADEARVVGLLEEYYQVVFSYDDGFSGRNANVAKRLSEKLKEKAVQFPAWIKVAKKYQPSCIKVTPEKSKEICVQHFNKVYGI
ncbi:MAG: thioredoxin family protein [Oligoflexales bacterium]|nr:thioredoxin family protein [Oligoflexales bacterium]